MKEIVWRLDRNHLDHVATREELVQRSFQVSNAIETGARYIEKKMESEGRATREEIAESRRRNSEDLQKGFEQTDARLSEVSDKLSELDETQTKGFIALHVDLIGIERELQDFSALVDLNFGHVESRLGGLSDLLTDLVQVAKTPEQTWALEQFDIGRDALRKNLYHEAVEHFDRAINGYKDRTGYKLDHRPHQMLGIIYRKPLDFNNFPTDLEDYAQSEKSYLSAARYAEADYKADAARALCGAAEAAYILHDVPRALQHLGRAIQDNGACGLAHFLRAKCWFKIGNDTDALQALREAILLDDMYSVKWANEGEFTGYSVSIENMIGELTSSINLRCNDFKIKAVAFMKWVLAAIDRVTIHEVSNDISDSRNTENKNKLIENISRFLSEISIRVVSKKEYLDALRVKKYTLEASNELYEIARNFTSLVGDIERALNMLPDKAKYSALADRTGSERKHLSDDDFWGLNLLVAALSFVALVAWALYELSNMSASWDTFSWIVKAIILVPIGAILATVIFNAIRKGLITLYNGKLTSDRQQFFSVQNQRGMEAFERACTAIAPFKLELAEAKEVMALQLKVISSLGVASGTS